MKMFKFEVQGYTTIEVDGFTDKDMARTWLIDNLEEEVSNTDFINNSVVSDGEEVEVVEDEE